MKPDQISSIFWMVPGVIVIYLSCQLGLGSLSRPGPGFMTFWAGVILCLLAVLLFLHAKFISQQKMRTVSKLWLGVSWSKPTLILIGVLGYGFVFEHIGYILATTALLILFFRAIEPIKWWKTLSWAVISAFISFAVFDLWLQVQLPHWIPETFLFKIKRILF